MANGRPGRPKNDGYIQEVMPGLPPSPVRKGSNPQHQQLMRYANSEEGRASIAKIMTETLAAYKKPKVKNDEELAERLEEYFTDCAEQGVIPTIEEMQLQCGYNNKWFWDVENGRRGSGFSPHTKEIIAYAKEVVRTFDAKFVVSGGVNPVVYIFRAKNFYGMRDQTDVTLSQGSSASEMMSAEDIAQKYLDEGEDIDTEFTD